MTGQEIGEKLSAPGVYNSIYGLGSNKEYDVSKLIPKVKIPKYVADYIDYCKRDIPHSPSHIGVGMAMQPEYMCACMPDEIERWLTDNDLEVNIKHEELFARAWLYGYEIQQEEKFVLPMEGTEDLGGDVMYAFIGNECNKSWTSQFSEFEADNIVNPDLFVTQSQIDSAPEWVKVVAKNKVKVEVSK